MRKVVFWLLLIVLITHEACSDITPRLYNEKLLKADLTGIKEQIIRTHPAPFLFTSKERFDSIFDHQMKMINHSISIGEYYLIAVPLVEALHCGHSWLGLPDNYLTATGDTTIFFPLGLDFISNRAYASIRDGSESVIPSGAEILSINGIQMEDIIGTIKKYVFADGFSDPAKVAAFGYGFNDIFALLYGTRRGYDVTYMEYGKNVPQSKHVDAVTRYQSWNHPSGLNSGYNPNRRPLLLNILPDKRVAVITIRTFAYYDNRDLFNNFIDSAFYQVKKAGVSSLIIDVRGNRGGDPYASAKLLSYLEREPMPYFAKPYDGYIALAKPIQLANHNTFEGNVYVLIDGACFSTTGHFCALLRYHKRGTFIGEETGGTFECNDNSSIITTHAGLKLSLPHTTYTTAVKDMQRDHGILPDYLVIPKIDDLLKGHDTVLDFAFELIQGNKN
jgi:hypothetical protein